LLELERRIAELKAVAVPGGDFDAEIARLEEKSTAAAARIFGELAPWQKVQLCRHADRPYTLDYVARLFGDWIELHGDRGFCDDRAIVGGWASFRGRTVMVVGHQKGRGTKGEHGPQLRDANPKGTARRGG